MDIDIIIDDAFLDEISPQEKPLFSEIYKMIWAMNNIDEEELQLQKNLDGEIDESPEKGTDQ